MKYWLEEYEETKIFVHPGIRAKQNLSISIKAFSSYPEYLQIFAT